MSSTSTFYKTSYFNKLYEKEVIIQKQNKQIEKLNTEIMNQYQENQTLKGFRKQCFNLEEQMKQIENEMQKLKEEKSDIIKKRDENDSLFKRKISELENLIEYEKLDYEKKTELFHKKLSVFNQIVMENELYSEEIKKLKEDLEKFEKTKNEEFQQLKIENIIKFDKVKKKMLNTIKLTNETATKLNNEYMNTSNKLFILQNKQLKLHIDYQKEKIDNLQKTNDKLMNKINNLQKDIDMHKLVERDLLLKSKGKDGGVDTSIDNKKTRYRTFFFKKKKDIKYYAGLNKKRINKSESKDKNNNIIESPRLNKSNSVTNIISKPSVIERRLINYQKQIKEKKFENENILIKNSKLKNRLHLYYNKFNGLFFFLEESIQNFFRDQTLLGNKHFQVKMEDIKKFKFEELNKEEQYSILVLLMKHLMPLITLNFNNKDNIGKEIFKTNLNIIDKNFNMNQNYLQDKFLKNAFMDNNKYYKDLHISAKNSFTKSSIPVLRKLQNVDLDFYEFKNRAIFS